MSEQVLTDFEIVQILNTDRPKTGWAYGLCREVEAKVVSRCRAQGGNTSDNITQAASNKAAEEGELPALPKPELYYCDSSIPYEAYEADVVREYARQAIAADRASRPQSYSYEQAHQYAKEAVAYDRASRQVANKAEQETRAAYRDRPTYDEKVSIGSRDFFEMLIEYGKEPSLSKRMEIADFIDSHIDNLVANKAEVEPEPFGYVKFRAAQRITTEGDVDANEWYEFCEQGELGDDKLPAFPLYATPPATTGASTAPADPSMPRDMTQAVEWIIGLRARVDSLLDVIEAEREVAAQAGQVAVPEWISVDDRMPGNEHCLAAYVNAAGKHRVIRAMYAGQFQIDAGEDAIDQGNCEYNEADDTFYLKAGWLECIDNWDDYSSIYVTEGTVTHWRRLPAAPSHTTNKEK